MPGRLHLSYLSAETEMISSRITEGGDGLISGAVAVQGAAVVRRSGAVAQQVATVPMRAAVVTASMATYSTPPLRLKRIGWGVAACGVSPPLEQLVFPFSHSSTHTQRGRRRLPCRAHGLLWSCLPLSRMKQSKSSRRCVNVVRRYHERMRACDHHVCLLCSCWYTTW